VLLLTLLGAPTSRPLHLYRSLVRSKLDYGSVMYGSAREFYLRILDPIQNHALRLCLGAFRTSPASSMCVHIVALAFVCTHVQRYTDMESEDYAFYQGLVYLMNNNVEHLGYDLTFSTEVCTLFLQVFYGLNVVHMSDRLTGQLVMHVGNCIGLLIIM